jgi:hypothetical protein
MKTSFVNSVFGIFLLATFGANAQDTLKSSISVNSYLCADVTNIGYYGGIGTQVRYKKIGLSLSYIIDYSKTELPFNGPSGFAFSISYYPNPSENKKINHYINTDYRLVFHKRFNLSNSSNKFNKTHEINLGYGVSIKIIKNLSLSNAINIGWFIENSYSDRTNKTISNNGNNTLIQTRINFSIK